MRGVGPGTALGGRYTVHRRLEQLHGTERWSADDTTLGRRVSILCAAADDHRTPALLDAARRAAGVAHVVFVRILDVGTEDGIAFVVEEELGEARTLAQLVTDGGVPGDEVRRITGEVASALESARARGMHHLDLKPGDVLRTPDGDVRLRGLETAAVRVGADGTEAEEAARRDAVGVVALTYAGLTGLWPLATGASGLASAPRVPGGVASPSEIAAGVPRDLDAICRLTLNDDQGPTTPGDFARQVAPWPSRQVVGRPVVPAGRGEPVAVEPPASEAADRPADAEASGSPEGEGAGAVGAVAASGAETASAGTPTLVSRRSEQTTAVHPVPDAEGLPDVPRAGPDDGWDPGATRVIPLPARGAAQVGPEAPDDTGPGAARGDGDGDGGDEGDDERWDDEPDDERWDDEPVLDGDGNGEDRRGRAGVAVAGAGAAVAGAFSGVGERVGGLARRAVDKVSELSPDSVHGPGEGGLEAPAPLVPAEPLTKDESKLALGIVAGFLVLALVIGIWGVSRIGSNTDLALGGPAPATRTTTVAPSSGSPPGSPSAGQPATPEPLAILKVEAYDPEGDGEENDSQTPRIYDGDRETGWASENYRTDAFGGLKKGVGVIVDLGPNKKPQTVELVLPEQADVEVHVGPDNRLEGAARIGEKKAAEGTVRFDVPADVSGQYIVVWFTELAADDRGKRRAWLNEVVVTG